MSLDFGVCFWPITDVGRFSHLFGVERWVDMSSELCFRWFCSSMEACMTIWDDRNRVSQNVPKWLLIFMSNEMFPSLKEEKINCTSRQQTCKLI